MAGVWNPGQLLPVRVFESVMHFGHVQLEQPVRFTYSRDGIHHIYFDPMEPAWSRNYKKAILSTAYKHSLFTKRALRATCDKIDNFDRCIRMADIAYGMQADEEAKQRGQHNNKPYQEQRERTDNEQQMTAVPIR
uniref:Vitellogenin domain-containing protein n=1 Tax=Globodera pallida TaxID=36090 RepID=A0A183C2S8_GLOPA